MFLKRKIAAQSTASEHLKLNTVVRTLLDNVSGRIMAVDNDLNIIYMNKPAKDYLLEKEAVIKTDLPQFDARKLMGANIDVFHKNPSHQRRMLEKLEKPYITSISISGEVFNLRAIPLVAPDGEHLGSAVEWLDPVVMDNAGQVAAIKRAQAVIEFDLNATILSANDNFLNALGYRLEEVVGKSHKMFVEPAYGQSQEYIKFWDDLRDGKFKAGQFRRVAKNGDGVWIEASYNPILDMRGRPFKIVKYATEVTAQVEMTQQVVSSISEIYQSTSAVTQQVALASAASTQTMTNVQAVASGAEEMDASVREISRNMSRSKQAVDDMVEKAGGAQAETAKLSEISAQMTNIVGLIQGITSQINLLALNATIEAARAGEAGKGFAVVASEVKNLANQAAEATGQINEQIAAIQGMSSNVAVSVSDMGHGMNELQSYISTTAAAVEEQSAVSQEMAANMQSASTAVEDIVASVKSIESSVSDVNKVAQVTSDAAAKIVSA